ncbi:MAG: hypothetical protein WC516_06895 [Patescibacteria group bacterium]|jgi:ABC-type Mn2+/Zn2+ transport system ATPase subunit
MNDDVKLELIKAKVTNKQVIAYLKKNHEIECEFPIQAWRVVFKENLMDEIMLFYGIK